MSYLLSNSKAKVFCSYQWNNSKEIVHKICDRLVDELNYDIWIDRDQLNPGQNLFAQMESGIHDSHLFLAFISSDYCKSANCKREINYANQQNKKCLYVMLEKDLEKEKLDGIALLTAGYYRLNAFEELDANNNWSDRFYMQLVTSIDDVLNDRIPSMNQ